VMKGRGLGIASVAKHRKVSKDIETTVDKTLVKTAIIYAGV